MRTTTSTRSMRALVSSPTVFLICALEFVVWSSPCFFACEAADVHYLTAECENLGEFDAACNAAHLHRDVQQLLEHHAKPQYEQKPQPVLLTNFPEVTATPPSPAMAATHSTAEASSNDTTSDDSSDANEAARHKKIARSFLDMFIPSYLLLLCSLGMSVSWVVAVCRVWTYLSGQQSLSRTPRPSTASDPTTPYDVVVVGAGPVGCAAAHACASLGHRVLVVERDLRTPDRIVGELLQPGGYNHLVSLGLHGCVEGIDAQPAFGYYVQMKENDEAHSTMAVYPPRSDFTLNAVPPADTHPLAANSAKRADGRVNGVSFHHGLFVDQLRRAAVASPNVEMVQGTVTNLVEENGCVVGVSYKDEHGAAKTERSPMTIVVDGTFSSLRRELTTESVSRTSCFGGLLLKDVSLPAPGFACVLLADPCPILAYQVDKSTVRMLIDYPVDFARPPPGACTHVGPDRRALTALEQYMMDTVPSHLPAGLVDAFKLAITSGGLRTMPNQKLTASPCTKPGALMLGDAFNMRHPFTGGGMTVGFSDVVLLRGLLAEHSADFHDHEAIARVLKAFYRRRRAGSGVINTLAICLYRVFSIGDGNQCRMDLRSACFSFFCLGDAPLRGPISFLSGLKPHPWLLLYHFCKVALYGVKMLVWPWPTPDKVRRALLVLLAAAKIMQPCVTQDQFLW